MENGELERMQRALEQWVQQHPEEVRRLQERFKPLAEFLNSSEWDDFWQPAKAAILQGDETGIRAWVEDRIGIEPDSVLRVRLSAKKLGEATPRETWDLVDGREGPGYDVMLKPKTSNGAARRFADASSASPA